MEDLSRIPVGGNELQNAVRTQQEAGEIAVLQLLETLESELAEMHTRLCWAREVIAVALAGLQRDHAAQVNLLSILGGTRFKYGLHGMLVPTRCPHWICGRPCSKEDSYLHLLQCYSLSTGELPEAAAADFLMLMARRTKTARPGAPVPMCGV